MDQLSLLKGINFEDYVNKLPWNKSGRKWGKRQLTSINKIVVHQSLSEGSLTAINNYLISPCNHVSPANGCPHIAYHMAIGKDGTIFLCNNFDDITWHTKGQNEVSLGICVLGNFIGTGYNQGSEPTKEQLDSLDHLIKRLITNFNSKENPFNGKNIYGHYHFGKPACPGKTISGKIENFRNGIITNINRLDSIKDIQLALISLGYNLPKYGPDGFYGTETKLALCKLQTENNIPISGYADELTKNKLAILLSTK
jgi:hypothetical protein